MAREVIILPDIPADAFQLEDFVAALFQSVGYFVQRGVTERDPTDVLELDAVVTDYAKDPPAAIIVEAKSGGWGYPDIFKLAGWMRYLSIPRGAFFVQQVPEGMDLAKRKARAGRLDVALAHLAQPDLSAGFIDAGFPAPPSVQALTVWRFSYMIERCLLKCVRKAMKDQPGSSGPRAIWEYYNLVNNSIFFEPDDYERVGALFGAFARHPKLSLGVAREIGGEEFNCEGEGRDNPQMRDALYRCAHPLLQACFYIEHRARLAVLKAVVDIVLLDPTPKTKLKLGPFEWTQLDMLPANIKKAVLELRAHPAVRHYPRFWQVFLLGCGGFYLRDRRDEEFEWLARQTGVPVGEVENALRAFDICFPLPAGSWMKDAYESECRVVAMVPCVLQGLGVYHRMSEKGAEAVGDLGYKGNSYRDLLKWYEATYQILKDHSGLPTRAAE